MDRDLSAAPNENIDQPLKHSTVKRISVLKRQIQAYFYPPKTPMSSSVRISQLKVQLSENYRDQNLPFRKFQPEKRLPKILDDLFTVKIGLKWAIIPFFRCSKILGEAGKQEILQQMFRKFQIANRLPNRYFRKLTLGAPDLFRGQRYPPFEQLGQENGSTTIDDKIFKTLSLNGVTSKNNPQLKLEYLLFPKVGSKSSTTSHGGDGEGNLVLHFLKSAKRQIPERPFR